MKGGMVDITSQLLMDAFTALRPVQTWSQSYKDFVVYILRNANF